MSKVSALSFQGVSMSYIGWVSNGSISTSICPIQNISIFVVIVDCRHLFSKRPHCCLWLRLLLSLCKVPVNRYAKFACKVRLGIQLPVSHVSFGPWD